MQKESQDQTIPDKHQGTKISTNPNPRETRERERGESGEGTLVHGDGAGEDGRPMEELRRPEERRRTAAAAGPREEGLEQR
jgi:hypothetical protein